eukprot:301726_1
MTHLCAHFGSAKGCRYGSKCHFSHDNPSSIPVCKRFLSKKCRYGTTCKFRHIKKELEAQSTSAASAKSSTRKPNPHSFIDLKHLDVYLRYEGRCSSMNTNEHIGAHTLYRYYDKNNKDRNSRRATHLLEFHTNKNRVHLEYQTDIATQHKNVSLYSCGLLHANKYIFIHQSGIIYKCCCVKRAGANDIFACKTVDHIQLADYKNNIELIKTSATCDTQYYTIHELCICNEKRDYIMCYSLYVSPVCMMKVIDMQIFNVAHDQMKCIYHVNKCAGLDMSVSASRLSVGPLYWLNERVLFHEEYNRRTGLGELCVGWDSMDCKQNRDVLSANVNGSDDLVDLILAFVSSFNYLDQKTIIFEDITSIQMDQNQRILYISYKKQRSDHPHCYRIV